MVVDLNEKIDLNSEIDIIDCWQITDQIENDDKSEPVQKEFS